MNVKINNLDLEKNFGIYISERGLDDFFIMPKRKESLTNDSLDRDGQEVDLVNPKFEQRKFNLGVIQKSVGNSLNDAIDNFWLKYNALFTELSKPGVLTLEITDIRRIFHVYYSEFVGFSKYTKLIPADNFVWCKYEIVFLETDPNLNLSKVFLIDDQERFLIQ